MPSGEGFSRQDLVDSTVSGGHAAENAGFVQRLEERVIVGQPFAGVVWRGYRWLNRRTGHQPCNACSRS
jgi:hypothetical protein